MASANWDPDKDDKSQIPLPWILQIIKSTRTNLLTYFGYPQKYIFTNKFQEFFNNIK
jgi:transposase-like protein